MADILWVVEGGSEYGLSNAAEAVKRHLPRAANAPNKVRTGAKLAIILVTDEIPEELRLSAAGPGFLVDGDTTTCHLSGEQAVKLDQFRGGVLPRCAQGPIAFLIAWSSASC